MAEPVGSPVESFSSFSPSLSSFLPPYIDRASKHRRLPIQVGNFDARVFALLSGLTFPTSCSMFARHADFGLALPARLCRPTNLRKYCKERKAGQSASVVRVFSGTWACLPTIQPSFFASSHLAILDRVIHFPTPRACRRILQHLFTSVCFSRSWVSGTKPSQSASTLIHEPDDLPFATPNWGARLRWPLPPLRLRMTPCPCL